MKAYETMVDVRPSEKTTATGERLIQEHGGLGYMWMGSKVFVKAYKPIIPPRRMYKNHPNGRGIQTWKCRQCDTELNDLISKNIKKRVCAECKKANRRLRDRIKKMEALVCNS